MSKPADHCPPQGESTDVDSEDELRLLEQQSEALEQEDQERLERLLQEVAELEALLQQKERTLAELEREHEDLLRAALGAAPLRRKELSGARIELATTFVRHSRLSGWVTPALVAALALIYAQRPVTLLLAGLLLVFCVIADGLTRPRIGAVRVDEEGMTLDGERIGRDVMHFGNVVPATPGSAACVTILGKRRALLATVQVPEEVGVRILSTLGIGAVDEIVVEGEWAHLSVLRCMIGIGFVVGFIGFIIGRPEVWLVGLASMAGSKLTEPWRLVLAKDGISVVSPLRLRRRFVPWSAVVSARRTSSGVEVKLTNGALAFPAFPAKGDVQDALVAQIEGSLAAYYADDTADLGVRLARGGRDRRAWLRGISEREGDYRSVPTSEEQLWRLIESAGTPATARAAAALILTRGASDEDRRRLRIAAEACTSPRLRIVLEQAGSGADEEALGEALDKVDDERQTARVDVAGIPGGLCT